VWSGKFGREDVETSLDGLAAEASVAQANPPSHVSIRFITMMKHPPGEEWCMAAGRTDLVLVWIVIALVAVPVMASAKGKTGGGGPSTLDYDPSVDLVVTVTVTEVWALDEVDDDSNPADFYCTISIASLGEVPATVYTSLVASNQDRVIGPYWTHSANVNDSVGTVVIIITLYDDDGTSSPDDICDISMTPGGGNDYPADASSAYLLYDLDYGSTFGASSGEDYQGDKNGVFHVSGVQDGSTDTDEDDCELWFQVTQNDKDGDGLTYRDEQRYGTSFTLNDIDAGTDLDSDGIPLWWEDRYSFCCNDLDGTDATTDWDNDGIDNLNEFQYRSYGCRPDYPNILIEVDCAIDWWPSADSFSFVVDYYRSHLTSSYPQFWGIEVDFILQGVIPMDRFIGGQDDQRLFSLMYDDIVSEYRNLEVGVFRYCLLATIESWMTIPGDIIPSGVLGYIPDNVIPADEFVIYSAAVDNAVDDWNDDLFNSDISFTKFQDVVILHELGHCLGIGLADDDGEVYCEEAGGFGFLDCCMAHPIPEGEDKNLDLLCDSFYYCDGHWDLLDVAGGLP
jgi:hypothetical protein